VTPVIWTKSALADVRNIRRYIADFNLYAAHDMASRLIDAGNSLGNFPHRGRIVPKSNFREMTLIRPYVIRYCIERDYVAILRVRHSARLSL
jgi:toxin ParE1/3/4